MVAGQSQNLPALAQLYVYVTDLCNCTCVHCWIVSGASGGDAQIDHFISPNILESAITEAIPLGLNAIKWTGGEPTIHPNFPALLAIQKKYGLRGRMETNGLRMTPELAQMLVDSGVTHVSVSLDGAQSETHDAIRGVRGAWEKAVAGIGHLVAAGFQPQIIMSLMRRNVAELEDMLMLAGRLGAGSLKFNVVQPNLKGEQLHAMGESIPVAELIALNRQVERELASRVQLPIYFDVPLAFRSLHSILDDGANACGIKNILGLLANGEYALCGIGIHAPGMVFGSAGHGELENIWRNHPVIVQVRDGLPAQLTGVCGNCVMKTECLGSCIAQNFHDTGDLMTDFWLCRVAVEEGIFPRSRMI